MKTKQIIVGVSKEGKHLFLHVNEDGTADWVEDKAQATAYEEYSDALSDWHGLNKSLLRRIFIANAE